MSLSSLHHRVRLGDVSGVRRMLGAAGAGINAPDRHGRSPLMVAMRSCAATPELCALLIERGADALQADALSSALASGVPWKVRLLLQHGADIHYQRPEGYNALLDAVHGRDVLSDQNLLDLLRLLAGEGVNLDAVTMYRESGLSVLSRIGRFDAVRLLLDAGANPAPLEWTPLMHAVALGTLDETAAELARSPEQLEARDGWERTPWLLAIQTGEIAKAHLLLEHGAEPLARGRCAAPAIFHAIRDRQIPMLKWLLEMGVSLTDRDQFGRTPLMEAVEQECLEAVLVLLDARVEIDADDGDQTALSFAGTREVALALLERGADPQKLSFEARRALLGFEPEPDLDFLDLSADDFRAGRSRRFGVSNPEILHGNYYQAMIRAGVRASEAAALFKGNVEATKSPVWCAQRFGQSITLLPDGRIIQIAGEHEDSYDSDFCIYNDVFVHELDGKIRVFAYPSNVFPPTDFHTATLLGGFIYLIGSLGYKGKRDYGKTPVYRLDTATYKIVKLETRGDEPGWIYEHRALVASSGEITITGGKILTWTDGAEAQAENTRTYRFHTGTLKWTVQR
jgi:ankyrin repeat protein